MQGETGNESVRGRHREPKVVKKFFEKDCISYAMEEDETSD